MLGEVPIRDFMAYDPGRYYWSAAVMSVWGDSGIVPLRGRRDILPGDWRDFRPIRGCPWIDETSLLLFCFYRPIMFVMWMSSGSKYHDNSQPLILIAGADVLIEKPTKSRYFFAGLCVGLAAVVGRNHGVYGVAGSAGVMLWLSIKRQTAPGFCMASDGAAGVAVGYLPVIVMLLLVPGFAAAFWESIRFQFEIKATNLPLPVPWPGVPTDTLPTPEATRQVMEGLL